MSRYRQIVATPFLAAGLALALTTGVAWAGWSVASVPGGAGAATASSVETATAPTAVAAANSITVSWPAATLSNGHPVDGYLVARYDAGAHTQQSISAGCAGVVAATTCTENGLPDGRWVYTVTSVIGTHWIGAESMASAPVTTDSTQPANALTTNVIIGNAAQIGATIYYRGTAVGSFTLTNAVTDAGSGAASSTSALLTGDVTGWTDVPSTVSAPAGGPYVSAPFSWAASTTGAPIENVTGRDLAGNAALTSLSLINDSTPPTAGTISYADGYQPDQSVIVTFAAGTDSGSGVATRELQRSDAVLTDGLCGTFTSFTAIGSQQPTTPYIDTQVANDFCYVYRYVVTDRVGNQDVAVSPSVAKVDSSVGGPALGTAGTYSVLAGTGVVNTLATTISGDLGVSPSSSIAGFPPGTVSGTVNAANAAAANAQSDLVHAYDDAGGRVPVREFTGDQNGQTFDAGTYHTTAAFALTGTLTLDGQGDSNSLFIFQVGAALNTAAASHMALINGAQAAHVFWQVNGAAGTGAASSFAGTIMAAGAITLGAGTQLIGRALAYGTVTLADNTVRFATALPPIITIDGGATVETKNVTPTITGTTSAPATTVAATIAGQTLTGAVNIDGSWSVTATALTAGDHTVAVIVRDQAGNAASATQTLTIEVNPATVLLNSAATYSVLTGANVVGTGTSSLSGDLGVSPGTSVTGFPPGTVAGAAHTGDVQAAQAESAFVAAYNDAASRTPSSEFSGDQNGVTFHEGVHDTAVAFTLTGTLTLDAQGDPNAIFIIQVGAALNTAAASHVALVNGAQASHVFWQVAGAAGTGASSSFAGIIMAAGAITLGDSTQLTGQALAYGTITLANNTIEPG
jgi:Ice-binding-like/Bacterial Ig-like domain